MTPDVVGVGANSLDLVYRLPAYPQPAGPLAKIRIASHTRSPGGQTATAMCACAALGLRSAYVGVLSTDGNGELIRDALVQRGVDVSRAVRRRTRNAFAVILIAEPAGERIVLWDRGDGLGLDASDLPTAMLASARVVHVDDVDVEAAIRAATIGRHAGRPVTSDIEAIGPRTGELVAAVTIPIFAEHVPAALTGEADLERALRIVRQRHPGMLCVTLGEHGAVLLDGDRFIRQPAFAIDPIDTTGAGDIFRGAFIAALARGDGSGDILRFAAAAAALSCTRRGAITSVPSAADVDAFLRTAQTRL